MPISAKFGRKYTLLAFSLVFLVGAILTTIAAGGSKGLAEIYAGRVISGLGIGAISAVAPSFVSECSPKAVRGRITGCFQIMVRLPLSQNRTVVLSGTFSGLLGCNDFILHQLHVFSTLQDLCLTVLLDGVGIHIPTGVNVWRIPFGMQLVPAGIMVFGLLTVKVCLFDFMLLTLSTYLAGISAIPRVCWENRTSS